MSDSNHRNIPVHIHAQTNGFKSKKQSHDGGNQFSAKRAAPHDKYPKRTKGVLPVCEYRGTFMRLLNESQTIVLVGETGSGKTTQIPQWCLEYCIRRTKQAGVACTQPRRIAAMSVATRVAKEMNCVLGEEVGYSVRFDSQTSDKTRLKYLTDGMLLREAMLDGMLKSYGVIILDEAHERTLQTEILFGIIKRALIARNDTSDPSMPPLKVVVMSATINVKLFKKYFNSPMLQIEGRQHPVQDMFAEVPQSDLLTSTLICVFQIHRTSADKGDILVFCSGQDEIQSLITLTKRVLKQAPDSLKNLTPLPLYASLPAANQMRVFEQSKVIVQSNGHTNGHSSPEASQTAFVRRVIFATNVAETSVTIPNIKYVIDTGKVKCRTYCPKTGLESLKVTTISKAQAKQRSGRAGRVVSGVCYRLYTNDEFANMSDHLLPEIKRCNLDGVILQMISIGIKEIASFDFLEKPEECRIKAALSNLLSLKAIKPIVAVATNKIQQNHVTIAASNGSNGNEISPSKKQKKLQQQQVATKLELSDSSLDIGYDLTSIGKKLCMFPLNPAMSRILLAADELGCLDEALSVVSLLSIENLFHIPPNKQSQAELMLEKFYSNEGDTIMLLKVFRAFKRTNMLNKSGIKQWSSDHFINVKNLKMARFIRKQLCDLCKSAGMNQSSSCGQDTSLLRRALTYGLFNNVATMWDGKYRNKSSNDIHIHPSSCLFKTRPECILYVEIVETNKCYMRNCTLVDMNWIREVSSSNMKFDATASTQIASLASK